MTKDTNQKHMKIWLSELYMVIQISCGNCKVEWKLFHTSLGHHASHSEKYATPCLWLTPNFQSIKPNSLSPTMRC